MVDVALGIRPHSGWAVVVGVTATPEVDLVWRERIDVLAPGDPKQPWHAAQDGGLSPAAAAALAGRVEAGARAAADRCLRAIVEGIDADVVAAAVVGEPRDLPPADEVLANHMLLHAAEGQLYWSALAEAAADLGLEVLAVHPKAVPVDAHAAKLAGLGRAAGPPWQADHKLAVVAALTALGLRGAASG